MPIKVQINRVRYVAISVARADAELRAARFLPIELIIFLPPISEPTARVRATLTVNMDGTPLDISTFNKKAITPINFSPPCQPCIMEFRHRDMICKLLYGRVNLNAFPNKHPSIKAKKQEKIIKTNTYPSVFKLFASNFTAQATPARAQSIAWLSLDGIPKKELTVPKAIIVKSTMEMPIVTYLSNAPKEKTNCAIDVLIRVAITTPKKLKIPHRIQAFLYFIAPEEMAVATALGASVHPFTSKTIKAKISENSIRAPFSSQQSAVSSQQPAVSGQQPAVSSQQPAVSSQQSAVSSQQSVVGGQRLANLKLAEGNHSCNVLCVAKGA